MDIQAVAAPARRVFAFQTPRWVAGLVVAGFAALVGLRALRPQLDDAEGPAFRFAFIAAAALAVVGIVLLVWSRITRYINKRAVRTDRQYFAEDLLPWLTAGAGPVPFSLFLRPFFTDDRMKLSFYSDGDIDTISYGDQNSVEALLADALDRTFPTVTIGERGDSFGPGEILVDDAPWTEAFYLLAEHAEQIFIYPFAQPATAFEIDYLKGKQLLEKAIFLVPPLKAKTKGTFLDRPVKTLAQVYDASRAVWAQRGIEAPEFGKWGGAFVLDREGRISTAISADGQEFFLPHKLGPVLNALSGRTLYDPTRRPTQKPIRAVARPRPRRDSKRRRSSATRVRTRWPSWLRTLAFYAALVVLIPIYVFVSMWFSDRDDARKAKAALAAISEADWSCAPFAQIWQRLDDRKVYRRALYGLADAGNIRAQTLSAFDVLAEGVPPGLPDADARLWAEAAAASGDGRAMTIHALVLAGDAEAGAPKPEVGALLQSAAATGSVVARIQLGLTLAKGPQQAEEGIRLLDSAIDEGCPLALSAKAYVLLDRNTEDANTEALALLMRAAELNEPSAQYTLATLLESGLLSQLPADPASARAMMIAAARQGSKEAQKRLRADKVMWRAPQ